MTTGSDVVVPLGSTRAVTIRRLFMPERTQFLLMCRKKADTSPDAAGRILDALVEWDETGKKLTANTHELSVKYNELLDGAV